MRMFSFYVYTDVHVGGATTPSQTIVPTAGNNATGVIYTATIVPIKG